MAWAVCILSWQVDPPAAAAIGHGLSHAHRVVEGCPDCPWSGGGHDNGHDGGGDEDHASCLLMDLPDVR